MVSEPSDDLLANAINIQAYSGSGDPCSDVGSLADATTEVTPVRTVFTTLGYPTNSNPGLLHNYFIAWQAPDGSCYGQTEIRSLATAGAAAGGYLIASFDPNDHCQPQFSVQVQLTQSFWFCERSGCNSPPCQPPGRSAGGAAPDPVVRFCSVVVDCDYVSGGSDRTVLQGVTADVFDGSTLSTLRLGLFDDPAFGQDPLPDGTEAYGETTVILTPPPGDVLSVTISGSSDAFDRFDGDINADGATCSDDRDLMLTLVAASPPLNDPDYTARADFDLNGVIDALDLASFQALYDGLPDCNANGVPDGCDISQGTEADANSNGVPDMCEPGDVNCDGVRDGRDVEPFLTALTDPANYGTIYPACDILRADLDGSGSVDMSDAPPFIAALLAASP